MNRIVGLHLWQSNCSQVRGQSLQITSLRALVCLVFGLFSSCSVIGASAPLLYATLAPNNWPGRCAGAATDGTNFLVAAYTGSTRAIFWQLLAADNLSRLAWNGRTFLLVWTALANSTSNVVAQILTRDGMASSSPVQISATGMNAPYAASAAATNHVLAWIESTGQSNQWFVRIRSVADDSSPSEIRDVTDTPALTVKPVAIGVGGTTLLAVWNRAVGPFINDATCNTALTRVTNYWLMLFGRILDLDGTASGPEFQITRFWGNQTDPKIAFDGTNYLVAWRDERANNDCPDLGLPYSYAQRVSTSGELVGVEYGRWGSSPQSGSLLFSTPQFCYLYTPSWFETIFCVLLRTNPHDLGTLQSLRPSTLYEGYWQIGLTNGGTLRGRLEVS